MLILQLFNAASANRLDASNLRSDLLVILRQAVLSAPHIRLLHLMEALDRFPPVIIAHLMSHLLEDLGGIRVSRAEDRRKAAKTSKPLIDYQPDFKPFPPPVPSYLVRTLLPLAVQLPSRRKSGQAEDATSKATSVDSGLILGIFLKTRLVVMLSTEHEDHGITWPRPDGHLRRMGREGYWQSVEKSLRVSDASKENRAEVEGMVETLKMVIDDVVGELEHQANDSHHAQPDA